MTEGLSRAGYVDAVRLGPPALEPTAWLCTHVATGATVTVRLLPTRPALSVVSAIHRDLAAALPGQFPELLHELTVDERMAFVYKPLPGEPLAQVVGHEAVPPATALPILASVARLLTVCHARRVQLGTFSPW